MEFHIDIDINAPPDVVWSVMADIEHWPDWTPSVRSIRRLTGGPLAVGTRALIRQPKLPPALWTVTDIDSGRSFRWISRAPGVRTIAEHTITPAPDGSRVRLAVSFEGLLKGLMTRLTRSINNRYLSLEAEGLKRKSESLAHGPARGDVR